MSPSNDIWENEGLSVRAANPRDRFLSQDAHSFGAMVTASQGTPIKNATPVRKHLFLFLDRAWWEKNILRPQTIPPSRSSFAQGACRCLVLSAAVAGVVR